MNTSTKASFWGKLLISTFCFTAFCSGLDAQTPVGLPTCSGYTSSLLYYISGNQIYQYDPCLPFSSTNPWANSISGAAGGDGLALGSNIYAATPAVTFYVSGTAGNNYYWYNGTSWVNSGFNPGNSSAVNPTQSGNYLYNLVGFTGEVYANTSTGNGTLLTTVAGFGGNGPFDLQGDGNGNFYILNNTYPVGYVKEFNSAGTQINSWTTSYPAVPGTLCCLGGGFGIIGNTVYANVNISIPFWKGTITGSNIAFTPMSGILSPPPEDFATCQLGSLGQTGTNSNDTVFHCGSAVPTQLVASGNGPYTWSLVSGSATISGTGDTVTATANTTSQIRVVATSSSSPCVSNVDTFLIVVPGVSASANAGLTRNILGCGTYIDTLHAHFSSNTSWLNYHFNWTPSATITAGSTTLNPVIQPSVNTQYTLIVSTDTTQGDCAWKDSVKVNLVDRTVKAADTPDYVFDCYGIDKVNFSNSDAKASYFRWAFGDGSPDVTGRKATHSYKSQQIYTAQCFVSNETCKDSVNLKINLNHPLHAQFQPAKYTVCQGEALNFLNTTIDTTRNNIAPSFTWSFGDGGTSTASSPTYTYNFKDTGVYTVMLVAQDFVPCYDTTYANVTVISKPLHFSMDSSFCSPNTTVPIGLLVSNADSYLWNTDEKQITPTIIPKTAGLYTVTETNQCGTTLDSVNVILYQCDKCLFVPTAFTPNGDGRNDYFHVRQICPIRSYGIKIFSRFGQLVYSNYYISEGWNGVVNGVPADLGTYFYEIEYTPDLPNAHPISLKGDVTLIR